MIRLFSRIFRKKGPTLADCPSYRRLTLRIQEARAKHQPTRELMRQRTELLHEALRGAR